MVQKDSFLQAYEDYVLDAEAKGYIPWCRQWWEDQQEETYGTRLDLAYILSLQETPK